MQANLSRERRPHVTGSLLGWLVNVTSGIVSVIKSQCVSKPLCDNIVWSSSVLFECFQAK